MNRFAAEQMRRNRARDGEWELAANHRGHVSRRLASMAASGGRLCVLGAGNCNDLDLKSLGREYREIHLVDGDREALLRGVERQFGRRPAEEGFVFNLQGSAGGYNPAKDGGERVEAGVHLHGGIDLTGICEALERHAAAADRQSTPLGDLLAHAETPGPFLLPAPFDVVASTGILSQLIEVVISAVPEPSPWRWPLLLAVRTGHLRLCAQLTAPGGKSLIVSDFVSSASCPGLNLLTEAELAGFVPRLVAEHNFFHGLNPLSLAGLFARDAVLRELVAEVQPCGYWLWRQRSRTYAVLGLECRRAAR